MSNVGLRSAEFVSRSDVGDVADIAAAIAATITVTSSRWPALPTEHSTERTGVRVLANEQFDVWLLRWPQGTSVDPHDHGPSVGGFAVVSGVLEEIRWRDGVRSSHVVGPGQAVTVGMGVVHDVVGVTDGALSVHVYSPPLRAMTFYDKSGQYPVRREVVDSDTMDATVDREPVGVASARAEVGSAA